MPSQALALRTWTQVLVEPLIRHADSNHREVAPISAMLLILSLGAMLIRLQVAQ